MGGMRNGRLLYLTLLCECPVLRAPVPRADALPCRKPRPPVPSEIDWTPCFSLILVRQQGSFRRSDGVQRQGRDRRPPSILPPGPQVAFPFPILRVLLHRNCDVQLLSGARCGPDPIFLTFNARRPYHHEAVPTPNDPARVPAAPLKPESPASSGLFTTSIASINKRSLPTPTLQRDTFEVGRRPIRNSSLFVLVS